MEEWCRDYNEAHPHSAIGYKPPISLITPATDANPP
ncbi:hypothetical protein CW354_15520 [Marinicaulis flavus]|uniref:Integrase catalytic domain-containing protein n=1 Tax=Hyphococcus luteus TaxID=2058213 RepID=A0A2S7K317_9PROT|nr:hypothetical protein CW354_15520 [Marinicaulis flavus]